jgi:hypothetical protein
MLLQLLEHHHKLLLAAIGPLIWRKNCRELAALSATCRQLRDFIRALDFWKHCNKMQPVFTEINHIEILYGGDKSIRYNKNITMYEIYQIYWPITCNKRYHREYERFIVYNSKSLKSYMEYMPNHRPAYCINIHTYEWSKGYRIDGKIPSWLHNCKNIIIVSADWWWDEIIKAY